MNIDKAIAELPVELATLDNAVAVLDEHLGRVSHVPGKTRRRFMGQTSYERNPSLPPLLGNSPDCHVFSTAASSSRNSSTHKEHNRR